MEANDKMAPYFLPPSETCKSPFGVPVWVSKIFWYPRSTNRTEYNFKNDCTPQQQEDIL